MSKPKSPKKFTVNAAFFQEIKEDHQQLQCLLERLRELVLSKPSLANHVREFSRLLEALRDQLAFHFTLEEAYGYFEDALERAPHLHSQAGRLREQHAELYLMAQRVTDNSANMSHSIEDAERLADQFVAFDAALRAHESAETQMILEAIHQDVGVGD
jgi:hemerythrin